jgi:hypothetical protein
MVRPLKSLSNWFTDWFDGGGGLCIYTSSAMSVGHGEGKM